MSAAAELLAELSRRGVAVRADGETIRLKPKAALDGELLSRVKANKPEILNILSGTTPGFNPQLMVRLDPYAQRLQAALTGICRPDYPVGLIPWLGEHNPRLYAELTRRLPDDMNRFWRDHAPLEKFDGVLTQWSETHRTACELYRAAGKAEQQDKGGE